MAAMDARAVSELVKANSRIRRNQEQHARVDSEQPCFSSLRAQGARGTTGRHGTRLALCPELAVAAERGRHQHLPNMQIPVTLT